LEISKYLSVGKVIPFSSWTKFGRKFEIWTKLWTKIGQHVCSVPNGHRPVADPIWDVVVLREARVKPRRHEARIEAPKELSLRCKV